MTTKLKSLKGEPTKQEKVKTSVYLPKDIINYYKMRQIETGESMTAALERMARAEMERKK